VQQAYDAINLCPFYYGSVHKNKRMCFNFLVNDPHKTKFSNACDELPSGCSSHKEKVLSVWVILAQKYVNFIPYVFQVFCIVCGTIIMQPTYVIIGT
jgi:hypothetical protein